MSATRERPLLALIRGPRGRDSDRVRDASSSSRMPAVWAVVLFAAAAALLSAALPLFVYSTTLALFGLPHVMTELQYVDRRFGRRVSTELVIAAAVLLLGVVVVRGLHLVRLAGPHATSIELALVCGLGFLALPALARRGGRALAVGVAVLGALTIGTLTLPALTLVTLAVLHNATPVGFLVDKSAPSDRARVLAGASIVFFGVPLLVASGALASVLASMGFHDVNFSVFPTGPLRDHLGVYVPRELHRWEGAPDLFAAVTCAQVLHYGAVIGVLPRLADEDDRPRLPWPAPRAFAAVVVVATVGLVAHFAAQFIEARMVYGLVAGLHAWVEVPVLLLALAGITAAALPIPRR